MDLVFVHSSAEVLSIAFLKNVIDMMCRRTAVQRAKHTPPSGFAFEDFTRRNCETVKTASDNKFNDYKLEIDEIS